MNTLRVLDIIDGTSVDGPGLRTTVYFAGCEHHCPDCHNPQSWDRNVGTDMTIEQIIDHIVENDFDVTFSGGDPLLQVDNLVELARRVKSIGKNLWCYTGYTFEEIQQSASLSKILPEVDVIVDGRYVNSLRDISLHFRGSSNQRIIDVAESLKTGAVVNIADI